MTDTQNKPEYVTEDGSIDPQNYFDYIKSKKNVCTDEFLNKLYDVTLEQVRKAMITGQNLVVRRLHYALNVIEKEHALVKLGIDTFVLREDIEYFIEKIENKRVKVVDLEFFPRDIPTEIVERIAMLKEHKIFDNFYVVFTDYTGKISNETKKAVKKEEIRKDPIIFGTFEQKIDGVFDICDRFYYVGDWEDEYCDLTLTKMVQKMSEAGKSDITHTASIGEDITPEAIREYINRLDEDEANRRLTLVRPSKPSFFQNVKTTFKKVFNIK